MENKSKTSAFISRRDSTWEWEFSRRQIEREADRRFVNCTERRIQSHIRRHCPVSWSEPTEGNQKAERWCPDDGRCRIYNRRLNLPTRISEYGASRVTALTRRSRNFERSSKSSSHFNCLFGMMGLGRYSSRQRNERSAMKAFFRLSNYRKLPPPVCFSSSSWSVIPLDIERSDVCSNINTIPTLIDRDRKLPIDIEIALPSHR